MNRRQIDKIYRDYFNLPQSFTRRIPAKAMEAMKNQDEQPAPLSALDNASITTEAVSSAHGKMKILLLSYPLYYETKDIYKKTLLDLDVNLDKSIDFAIFTQRFPGQSWSDYSWMASDLAAIAFNNIRNYYYINAGLFSNFSQWVRDPFMAGLDISSHSHIYCIEPIKFDRRAIPSSTTISRDDFEIANQMNGTTIAGATLQNIDTNLIFHGGNTLVGDDFILVGRDYFDMEKKRRKKLNKLGFHALSFSDQDIIDAFQSQLAGQSKKQIMVIGTERPEKFVTDEIRNNGLTHIFNNLNTGTNQPFFHLDLFITLIGKSGDGNPYKIVLPNIINASDLSVQDLPELEENIIGPLNDWIMLINNDLLSRNFEVHFIDTPMTYFQAENDNRRIWTILPYNNCLVEIGQDNKIYMPTYYDGSPSTSGFYNLNLKFYDDGAEQTFKSLGFDVQKLGNYLPHVQFGGAVHCLTNCLQRN